MIGKQIAHYEITAKIGEGGMGEVYRATDSKLNRDVALKILPEQFAADSQRMGRFEREAEVLASLSHANIGAIHGIEDTGTTKALVLELIEGPTLAERIAQGSISLDETLRIALQIAEALEAAHEKGIVHRDLKPANIKLTPEGQVKVLDFGLAKAIGAEQRSSPDLSQSPTLTMAATQAGIILGTAAYMSPEQASGMEVDRRCDIWSFGIVLYEILSGAKPFEGETISHTMADVLRGEIDWDALPDDLPGPLERLLRRCLDRDASRRLRDIGEARIAIQDYLADPEAAAAQEAAAAEPRRALLPWAVTGMLAAVLVAVGGWWWLRPAPESFQTRFSAQVTDDALLLGRGSSVALSPDGRRMAWVVDGGAQVSLLTRSLDELEARVLASTSAAIPHSPFFSPDGRWVGYFSGSNLLKAPFAGGTSQTLTEMPVAPRGADWGPDGTIVVGTAFDQGLALVPAAGGEPTALTTLGEQEATHRWPQFLPDGKSVVFAATDAADGSWEDARIEIVDVASGERKVILRGGYAPSVLPSGHLIYAASGTIFAVPFDLDARETRGDPVPMVERVAANSGRGSAQYGYSDSGDLVYIGGTATLPTFPIVRVSRDGDIAMLWQEEGSYGKPRLSPDGKRLAVTVIDGDNWDIWVLDLERGVSTRLTFDDALDTEQLWSPDGQFIVFSSNRSGQDNLYRKRADGSGEVERLTEVDHAQWATSFSPDGRHLAMMAQAQSRDLYIMDLEEGGEPELFLGTDFNDDFAEFSPDGRWIAYSSDESGRPEVYVRPFPAAGGKWQISDSGGSQPRWAASGRELFYRVDDGLMAARIDGTGASLRVDRPQRVVEGDFRGGLFMMPLGNLIFNDYDTFPDGQSFIFFPRDAGDSGLKHATFVLDWFGELKEELPLP